MADDCTPLSNGAEPPKRFVLGVLLGIGLTAMMTACGGATTAPASHPSPSVSASAIAPNPVAIVRQAGAIPKPSSRVGEWAADGSMYASGSFSMTYQDWQEGIIVYAYTSNEAMRQGLDQSPLPRGDDNTVILTGDRFFAQVTATGDVGAANRFPIVSPEVVAKRLHATVVR
jgi:hypothetical protein